MVLHLKYDLTENLSLNGDGRLFPSYFFLGHRENANIGGFFFSLIDLGIKRRVVSALSRFGPGRFDPSRFGPGSFRPILVGRFGQIFYKLMLVTYGKINIYEAT